MLLLVSRPTANKSQCQTMYLLASRRQQHTQHKSVPSYFQFIVANKQADSIQLAAAAAV